MITPRRLLSLMSKPGKPFDPKRFGALLRTKELGRACRYTPLATSSMDVADKLLDQENIPHGSVVVVDSQTKGRGRNNRSWSSQNVSNLYFSLILHPTSIEEILSVNFAAPLAVAMAAQTCGVKDPKVKWPNDVWVKSRKFAGILLNTTARNSKLEGSLGVGYTVNLGIGVNINQDMAEAKSVSSGEATSIVMENGNVQIEREAFLAEVCENLESLAMLSRVGLMKKYEKYDMLVGNDIIVMPNKKEDPTSYYDAKAVGYSKSGYLLVKLPDGNIKTLSAEEVSIRPGGYYETRKKYEEVSDTKKSLKGSS
ncbi:hypothetical protein AAMO2058_000783400 [Amorphochlora amoebiformis]